MTSSTAQWPAVRIRDFATIVGGGTPRRSNAAFFGGDVPWITPKDLSGWERRFIDHGAVNLTEEGLNRSSARLVPRRTVLFSSRAPVGYVALAGRPVATNQGFRSLVCDERVAIPEFVSYSLRAHVPAIEAIASGATFKEVSGKALGGFSIPLPDLPTQRKVAAILSTYDDLIENSLRRIEILEEMARNLYREWFVEFRFADHERARFVDSPLGQIPEGWRVAKLHDLVDTQYGYTESAKPEPVGPKYLRGMDINKSSFIDWSDVPYCPIAARNLPRFRLAKKDVVVIRMADPGRAGIVEEDVDAVFASYLVRLSPKPKQGVGGYYLFYFLDGEEYRGYISKACTGTTRKSASAGTLTGVDIVVPSRKLLDSFEDEVGAIRGLLTLLVARNAALRQARDLLLPKLISGEIDVSTLPVRAAPPAGNGAVPGSNVTRYEFFRAIAELPFVDKVVLFGSRARGDHEEHSDIDLAVLCDVASDDDWLEVLDCLQEDRIDTLLKVDCVRFDQCDAALQENVLTEGVVLYEKGVPP